MGMSLALNTAITGLNAANRAAQVVSSNIANALTPGYVRRELSLSSSILGGYGQGVGVNGVRRLNDPMLLAERRLSDAALGQQGTRSNALHNIAEIFGTTETGSLADRFQQFENALVSAAARPDSDTRLATVLDTAKALAAALNDAGAAVQDRRATADAAIATDVDRLNKGLDRIRDLNIRITAAREGTDALANLQDMRQTEIDAIAEIVPIRLYQRDNGKVAIVTTGGQTLLDGAAAEIGFTRATSVDATASVGGILSGLTFNGDPVTGPPGGGFDGGRLAANFEARDDSLVTAQARLDAIARDLVERLSGTDADPTLAVGDPGLFTDGGAAFSAAGETGLAQRLSVNDLADPDNGGDLWRLRDGLGAASPGPVGDPAAFNRLIDVLSDPRVPASGDFGVGAVSLGGLFAAGSALAFATADSADYDLAFAQARSETLIAEELALGVDSDAELQTLLLVEQAYSANARVIQTADDMLNLILEI